MNVSLVIVTLIAHAICVELSLPFRFESPYISVTRRDTVIRSNTNDVDMSKNFLFRSMTAGPITRVLYAGVELFNDPGAVSPDFERTVHHMKNRFKDLIVVVCNRGASYIEGVYFKNDDRMFDITNISALVDIELYQRGRVFADSVVKLLYTKIPRVGIRTQDSPDYSPDGAPSISRNVIMLYRQVKIVVDEVNKIMDMVQIKRFTNSELERIGRSG